MYGIYKRDHNNQLCLIAACYTKAGARRSCEHFRRCCKDENNGATCFVEYNSLDSYWKLKVGYNILRFVRAYEKSKLTKLENKENLSRALRENQEEKIRSLY